MENLFKTKAEIAIAIAEKLHIQLSKSETNQIAKQPTNNSEAYQLYLKGKQLADTHSKQGLLKSIDYFNEAIKSDPNFALAYSAVGYSYLCLAIFFYAPTKESVFRSKFAIQTALELDENLADAYAIKGYSQLFEFELANAKDSFEKALRLNPNNAYGQGLYSNYFLAKGEFHSALKQIHKYVELNPHPKSFVQFSMTLMIVGEYQKAIDSWENLIELFPTRTTVYYGLALAYASLGNYDLALKNIQSALNIIESTENLALYAYIQSMTGNHKETKQILKKLLDNFQSAPIDLYDIAAIYNSLGDKNKVFEYIEKAYESKFSHLFLLKIDPRMKILHSDARFKVWLEKLGLV